MTNEELKKKIAKIIADYFCPQRNEHKNLWGDDRLCYSKMNFAECEWVTECTDALIAAGIGDLKEHRIFAGKDGSIKQLYSGEEVERIAKERDEYKHRAEVAERALNSACFILAKNYYTDGKEDWAKRGAECATFYKEQAERELARRRKMIKVGDKVICFTTGVKGIVIKQYYPTASPQQTMIQCFDGRKYHAPTSEFIKFTEENKDD